LAPDPRVVSAKLAVLEEAVGFLREASSMAPDAFVEDRRTLRAAERYLQLAAESVFDIGAHIIASLGFDRPQRYADIVPTLRSRGVISVETSNALMDLAGFRNLLVHDYGRVDHRRIHGFLRTRLGGFTRFAAEVAVFVQGSSES
jgi:uncharacterized protein YutE (UPF0331/DUF86 family)